jgi:hypothetical protein
MAFGAYDTSNLIYYTDNESQFTSKFNQNDIDSYCIEKIT